MIQLDHVTVTYPGATVPTFRDVTVSIAEGELCLVTGPTGSGKSTLLKLLNGLVPHATGGHLAGEVRVDGRTTRTPPRELADLVAYVGQDPASGFVTETVEDELAYTMENLGITPPAMRRRVEETLDLLGLHEVRDRALRTLSGGQQQRVAIGAVLTAAPRVLVLDEPTSALDPIAAEEVLATLARLVHDVGLTVVLAEHRLERALPFCDRVMLVRGDGTVTAGPPAAMIRDAPNAPPLVELARLAGFDPLPLTVREARRLAGPLRARLGDAPPRTPSKVPGDVTAHVDHVAVAFGDHVALQSTSLQFRAGEITALMGRNGAGKSTLLSVLAGLRRPTRGTVSVVSSDPASLKPQRRVGVVGLVPQQFELLLVADSVATEARASDRDSGVAAGTTLHVLDELVPGVDQSQHPRDLSEGQRLAVALAVVLAPAPRLLLLDEPTRGLDYASKTRFVEVLHQLAARGTSIVLATHDVELVARAADRAILLADGEVVTDGPARDVICHSPGFAPQVTKVLAPATWLTVDEVRLALSPTRATPS